MKPLTLKLIETRDQPEIGDLVIGTDNVLRIKTNTPFDDKSVLPYGLSDDEIKYNDFQYSEKTKQISQCADPSFSNATNYLWKVELLPEHFDYQKLVGSRLKDGEQFNCDWDYGNAGTQFTSPSLSKPDLTNGKAIISPIASELPKVEDKQDDKESELINLLGEYGQYCLSNVKNPSILNAREWFNLQK